MKKEILQKIDTDVKPVLKKYPIEIAYLFGSSVYGMDNKFSDLDIAVVVKNKIPDEKYLELEMELEVKLSEVLEFKNLDVRIINKAPLSFQGQILRDGILIYSLDEKKRVDFETTVRDRYFDYLPVILQMRKSFFSHIRKDGLGG